MKHRCFWVTDNELYKKYHDQEWGVPVYDDKKLFEFLILSALTSSVVSFKLNKSLILFLSMSKPIVLKNLPNSTANGKPT